jgi:hypothetical protein
VRDFRTPERVAVDLADFLLADVLDHAELGVVPSHSNPRVWPTVDPGRP